MNIKLLNSQTPNDDLFLTKDNNTIGVMDAYDNIELELNSYNERLETINDSLDSYHTRYDTIPFTFRVLQAGTITIQATHANAARTLSFSINGGTTWNTMTSSRSELSFGNFQVGDTLMLKGNNASYTEVVIEEDQYGDREYYLYYNKFQGTAKFEVYGNIMSLVHGDDFVNNSTLSSEELDTFYGVFGYFFQDNLNIISAKNLLLTPKVLTENCYQNMFSGCANLTTAPELPATTLANNCYSDMFSGCTSLTTAPELPATTLADYCYSDMFYGCTSLTTAPALPATTLTNCCYSNMFYGTNLLPDCTNIDFTSQTVIASGGLKGLFNGTKITDNDLENILPKDGNNHYCLPVTTLANYCYQEMFRNCTDLTTAPELPATTLASGCYRNMFYGCTSLTSAPELPATALANYCYYFMFYDCTSLTTAPELPATTLAGGCYNSMFSGCTSLTTAPELPSTTLANTCYYEMFSGCTSLNYIKALFTSLTSTAFTENWVNGVAANGTFVKNPNASWNQTGFSGVPTGWTVKTVDENITYFAFKSLQDSTFQFTNDGLSYSTDNGTTWTSLSANTPTPTVVTGNKILFKGELVPTKIFGIGTFSSTGRFEVQGNIMSLIFGDNYDGKTSLANRTVSGTTISYDYVFACLFKDCDKLVYSEDLILPATTLNTNCYKQMFDNCTSLLTTPQLPAKSLTYMCYSYMFRNCISLKAGPKLPATTLGNYCYQYMFENCTSLIYTTILPALTITAGSYWGMFNNCASIKVACDMLATSGQHYCCRQMYKGCTSLIKAKVPSMNLSASYSYQYQYMYMNCTSLESTPDLPSTTLGSTCYSSMFSNCTSLTKTCELPAMSVPNSAYSYMFYGCTSLVEAPELPATSVKNSSYSYMFALCTSLTKAPSVLPATNLYSYTTNASTGTVTLIGSSCYAYMFSGCTSLKKGPQILATELSDYCFQGMFYNCTSLEEAPALPVTVLYHEAVNTVSGAITEIGKYCYQQMFYNCISLKTAPALPATILTSCCYQNMFQNCTSLEIPPELPATTLKTWCYANMFYNCTKLKKTVYLPATTLETYCYATMFKGCISLLEIKAIEATTLATNCCREMFSGCYSAIRGPELKATTLLTNCYYYMFYGCGCLKYLKAMFTTTPSTTYTNNWLNAVGSEGVFIKNSAATWNVSGAHGIPSTWQIETASE